MNATIPKKESWSYSGHLPPEKQKAIQELLKHTEEREYLLDERREMLRLTKNLKRSSISGLPPKLSS